MTNASNLKINLSGFSNTQLIKPKGTSHDKESKGNYSFLIIIRFILS